MKGHSKDRKTLEKTCSELDTKIEEAGIRQGDNVGVDTLLDLLRKFRDHGKGI